MKKLTLILSFYIAALSLVPCADSMMYEIENDAIELSVNHQEHNHTDHSNDLCTPICACACCGSLVTISSTQPLSQLKLIVSTSYLFHYKFNYSFEYQEGILHPPTLG